MATHYLEEVRAVQPAGPYFLAGYCFGGLVAFEMAQQLHARGEAVGLLAVFNTYGPERRASVAGLSPFRRFAVRSARRMHVERENMRVLTLGEKLRYLLAQTSRVHTRLRARLDRARARQADLAPHLTQVVAAHDEAYHAYTPRPYTGNLTLFWSQHRFARSFVDPSFGWRQTITGELDIHLIPARTGSVIQDAEAVPLAAAELRQIVQRITMAGG
jgi:aspartate racemase